MGQGEHQRDYARASVARRRSFGLSRHVLPGQLVQSAALDLGHGDPWHAECRHPGPEYAIDQYTAVQLYTVAGAQLNRESHRRGTLQPRRLADLVAFRSDPITCPVDDLPSLRPVFTMVGGRVVYDPEARLGQ